MDKQKQQAIILGVLVLVLVIAIANALKPKKKRRPAAAPVSQAVAIAVPAVPAAPAANAAPAVAKASSDDLAAQQKNADKPWGVDPFFHVADKGFYQGLGLVLKGISIGPGRRHYATINSEIVTVGDMIYGYNVEQIERNKVLLKRGTESYYLVFPE